MLKLDPTSFAYSVLLLASLVGLANWIAPDANMTVAGCRLNYVYDGDTVALECAGGRKTARLVGLDAPETKSPSCAAEAELGKRATLRLRALAQDGVLGFEAKGFDKYGRVLAVMKVDGVDVADTLVSEGLAVAYRGGSRPNWCERLARD